MKMPVRRAVRPFMEHLIELLLAKRDDVKAWKGRHTIFAKLSLYAKRALLLKSPPHTARIKTILEILPNARLVHIHRTPYRVFLSQRHFFQYCGMIHPICST
ncbi:sulfotransferase [Ahrensia sp. 13_GOM-1096m]|uniref:sulfotransferase n=1 Tax=Ahrensia sp. 13_GOM-1096m TaxID=1380380 RepID=UPI0009DF7BEF